MRSKYIFGFFNIAMGVIAVTGVVAAVSPALADVRISAYSDNDIGPDGKMYQYAIRVDKNRDFPSREGDLIENILDAADPYRKFYLLSATAPDANGLSTVDRTQPMDINTAATLRNFDLVKKNHDHDVLRLIQDCQAPRLCLVFDAPDNQRAIVVQSEHQDDGSFNLYQIGYNHFRTNDVTRMLEELCDWISKHHRNWPYTYYASETKRIELADRIHQQRGRSDLDHSRLTVEGGADLPERDTYRNYGDDKVRGTRNNNGEQARRMRWWDNGCECYVDNR